MRKKSIELIRPVVLAAIITGGCNAGHPSKEQLDQVNHLVGDRTDVRWDAQHLFDDSIPAARPIDVLTLSTATEQSLAHNLSLIASGENLSIAHAQMVQAGLFPNPTIGQSGSFAFPISPNGGYTPFDILISDTINGFITQPTKVAVAKFQEVQANIDLSSDAFTLAQQVDSKYQEMISLIRRKRLQIKIQELYKRALAAAEARQKVGIISTPEVNRARLDFDDSRRQVQHLTAQAASARDAVNHIADMWVDTPTGQRVPLATLANIRLEEGASRIGRDDNSRRIAVRCGVRGRDMGSFVAECQAQVAQKVPLPAGYHLTWEGQFENQQRATARLRVIVPLSLLGVLGLLFFAFRRLRYAALIMVNVPFVLIGAVALLYLSHTNLSVSAMIGFIALSGVSVLNGTVLVGQFNQLRAHGHNLHDAVVEGSKTRLRPVLMSALMAAIGMYLAATSHGIGSEVQRPLALVVLGGGMMSAVVLTLIVLPVLYELIEFYFPAPVTVPEGLLD